MGSQAPFSILAHFFWRTLLLMLIFPSTRSKDHKKHSYRGAEKDMRPLCVVSDFNLSSLHKDGNWVLQPDLSFRFEMVRCRLRPYSHIEAKNCLKGHHLLFMGDSLTRYFYLSLAQLISKRRWGQRFAKFTHKGTRQRSILTEHEFGPGTETADKPWSSFYSYSNQVLNSDNATIELCDCFRDEHLPFYNHSGNHQQQSCYENRYFRYSPGGDLNNHEEDVRLTYIQWYGPLPMRGYSDLGFLPRDASFPSYVEKMSKKYCYNAAIGAYEKLIPYSPWCAMHRRLKGGWDFPPFFEKSLCPRDFPDSEGNCLVFEKLIIAKMNVTNLVMNIGWHASLWQPADMTRMFMEKLYMTARYLLSPRPDGSRIPSLLWRGTNSPAPFGALHDPLVANFMAEKNKPDRMGFFDLWSLTEPLTEVMQAIKDKDSTKLQAAFVKHRIQTTPRAKPSVSPLANPMIDHAHYEPYVYNELNNLWLNAMCNA